VLKKKKKLRSKSVLSTFFGHTFDKCFLLRVPQNHRVPWNAVSCSARNHGINT